MTPAEHYDWWFYSGICPGIPTRPANHALLREQLSAPAVSLIILWELLRENAGIGQDSYIAPHGIFGAHARIAAAARDVGATRLAEYLSTLPDASVVPETHQELKKLLKRFASQHKAELAADIARHGDPRAAPGFDKRQARRKCEEKWGENNSRYQVADRLPFFIQPLKKLRTFLAEGRTLADLSKQDEEMAHLAACFQYDFPRWAQAPQPPDVAQFLEECRLLSQQHPERMPAWGSALQALSEASVPRPRAADLSADRRLLDSLQAIGAYQAEVIGPATIITWDAAEGLDSEFGPMGLRLTYQGELQPTLLAAVPEARRRLAVALPTIIRELAALGRAAAQGTAADDLPPDDALLPQVTDGMLSVTFEEDEPHHRVECSWEVAWDPEHGCSFEIDEQGGVRQVE